MSGAKYIADTNCFIYLLDENPLLLPFANDEWAFSYITEIELLSKKDIATHEEDVIRMMLDDSHKIGHSQDISDIVINLRRNYTIKIPDAIIAASSLVFNLPIITADKAFAKIKEIDCIIIDF
jgi:predicted nucleic acid-binding protein